MGKVLDHPVILIRIAAVKSIRMNCACVSYRQTGDLSISAEDAILIKESVIGLTPRMLFTDRKIDR